MNFSEIYKGKKMEKESDLLHDPLFEGEEFFFPPPPPLEIDRGDAVEFSEESFRKAAGEILKDGQAVINRNFIPKGRKRWRCRPKGEG